MEIKMKNKAFAIIILSAITIGCSLSFAESIPGGTWDMAGSVVTKTIPVPTNEPNFPAGSTMQSRQVLEDADGDIVFGIWREDNNEFLQNPFLETAASPYDNVLGFYGAQTAYIEDVFDNVTTIRIAFDFKPDVIDQAMNILQVTNSWDIRTEPGTGDFAGTTRIRVYAMTYLPGTTTVAARTANSDWTVTVDQWHHVECWVQDSAVHLSMDGVELIPSGGNLETGLLPGLYPNLFIGSRWDGATRHFQGQIDNIEITYYEDVCGAWGFSDYDFNYDCYVDLADFAYFANTWLDCTDPTVAECVQAN
jgi:hypothetical protein